MRYAKEPQANGEMWSQRNQRRNAQFTDQFGRKYFAPIEIKTGMPCGHMQALFSAPLQVPQEYLRTGLDPERPYFVTTDFARWEQDVRNERRQWDKDCRELSLKKYGDQWDPAKGYPADILERVGKAPQAVEPVIAMRQGNSWVLGKTAKIDRRLIKFFEPEAIGLVVAEEFDFRDRPGDVDDFDAIQRELDQTGEEHLDEEIASAATLARQRGTLVPCEACGHEFKATSKFCGECGTARSLKDDLDERLALEEEADREARGGKREPVRAEASSETERKRAQRARERKETEERQLKAVQKELADARRQLEEARMEQAEENARLELLRQIAEEEKGKGGEAAPVVDATAGISTEELAAVL